MRTLCLLVCLCMCCPSSPAESTTTFVQEVIKLNRLLEPELDETQLKESFAQLVAQCQAAIQDQENPEATIAALNNILLKDRKISYLSNIYWRDASLSAAVLNGQCNCLAGSTLYVCIGQSLDLPIHMVLSPGHAFVRWENKQARINIETTNLGKAYSDEHYLWGANQISPLDIQALRYGKSLTTKECLAELQYIVAFQMRSRGQYEKAIDLMRTVCAALPHREDYHLGLLGLIADNTGDRQTYLKQLYQYLSNSKAPGIRTQALLSLADEYSNDKQFDRQRQLLLAAFNEAPKNMVKSVLHELAFCHRSLKDYRGGRRYLELYGALVSPNSPEYAGYLYNLAIMQKNDGDLAAALQSIDAGILRNPESWNLKVIKAGYLVLHGQRETGLTLFATVQKPRGDQQFWNIMQAWFYAVSKQRDKFYQAFDFALSASKSPRILTWLEQDVDLDHYRDEQAFKDLVQKHRKRLIGDAE